jgi:hypothetical protein
LSHSRPDWFIRYERNRDPRLPADARDGGRDTILYLVLGGRTRPEGGLLSDIVMAVLSHASIACSRMLTRQIAGFSSTGLLKASFAVAENRLVKTARISLH